MGSSHRPADFLFGPSDFIIGLFSTYLTLNTKIYFYLCNRRPFYRSPGLGFEWRDALNT